MVILSMIMGSLPVAACIDKVRTDSWAYGGAGPANAACSGSGRCSNSSSEMLLTIARGYTLLLILQCQLLDGIPCQALLLGSPAYLLAYRTYRMPA
jgi:hypothetical protein